MMKLISILLAIASSTTLTTYHANLNGASGVCLFVNFNEAECSGLKDVLVGQGYSAGACPSTHARSYCDASAEEQVTEVWLLGHVAFGVECDFNFDHLSHGYTCPPSGETREMAKYRYSEGLIDGACAVMEFDVEKCSKLADVAHRVHDWKSEPCPSSHTRSCDTLTERQESLIADLSVIFGHGCDDRDDATISFLCEDFSSIEFMQVYGEGTCETLGGYKTIMDGAKCEAAAIFLGKQDTTVNIHKRHGPADTRPAGCTYHQFQNLELWTESTGVCTSGQGCLCEVVEGSTPITPRRKTFHKMHSTSTCLSVEFDNTFCANLTNFLENDKGYIPGPCRETYMKSQCEPTDESEFEALAKLGIQNGEYCNLRSMHFTYSFACSKSVNKVQWGIDDSSASLSLLMLATVVIMWV